MFQVLKLVFLDIVWDFVYFPIWWYSRGLIGTAKWIGRRIKTLEKSLGVGIWIKNIFRPMYGQRDIGGKIISFFMRIVQIIFRGIVLIIFTAVFSSLLVVWIVAPIVVITRLLYS